MSPAVTQFTRTLGAHSIASVWVMFTSPALAAPYATVPGDGRRPLILPMLMMLPPSGCVSITAYAFWDTYSGARRFSRTTASENRGDAVAESAAGEPPGVLI